MATTMKLEDGRVVITETLADQPIQRAGANGQISTLQGATQDITTKYAGMDEVAILTGIASIKKQREVLASRMAEQLAALDAKIKLLEDAQVLLKG